MASRSSSKARAAENASALTAANFTRAASRALFRRLVLEPLGLGEAMRAKEVKHLSGGELQRVAIALCLGPPARSHLPLTPAAHPAALAGAVYLLRLASEADCQADPAACLLSWVVIGPMQGSFNPSSAGLDTYQHFGQAIAALPGFHSQGGAGLALAVGAGTDFYDDIPGAGMTGIQGTVFILFVDTTGVQPDGRPDHGAAAPHCQEAPTDFDTLE